MNVSTMSFAQNIDKIMLVLNAWKDLRPTKSFAGMSLTEFTAHVQPSLDARAEEADFEERRKVAVTKRDKADALALPIVARVVAAVIADEAEGEDGELYEQMGYVRKSERKSGLHRKGTPPPAK